MSVIQTSFSKARSEQGTTIVLVAICLLVLMGMAAIAVDMGGAWNERRQDQSAADVASLAAVQFADLTPGSGACAGYSGTALASCNGAREAIDVANATLDVGSAPLANWSAAAECVAPPSGYTTSPISPCIAFTANLQRAWVRVPTIEFPTSFGRVIGFSSVQTSAEAIAMTTTFGRGLVLPFLTPGVVAGGTYDCLKTSGNPSWGACADLPSTGNFGSADFFLYGNDDPAFQGTQKCNGDTNGRLVANIARGVDHPLGIHPTGSGGGIVEASSCPVFSAQPDMFQAQSGVGSNLDQGLTQGDSAYSNLGPYPGRIQDSGGYLVRSAGGGNPASRLDNVPLWNYLLPGACPGTDTPAEMNSCLNSSTGVIFEDSILDTGRFGFTPLLYESDFGNPSTIYHVAGFLPVFLDTTYYGCNASGCDIVHTPGVTDSGACPAQPGSITCGTPGTANKSLQAVTSYILRPGQLPAAAQTPFPGAANQRMYSLIK